MNIVINVVFNLVVIFKKILHSINFVNTPTTNESFPTFNSSEIVATKHPSFKLNIYAYIIYKQCLIKVVL